MGDITPTTDLNRAGRRAEARKVRVRKAGALAAAFPAALGTTALVLGAAASPAGAICSLQVSNLNDTGAGSLRDAVACASTGDIVTFQSGLTGTIPLDSEIAVAAGITIEGPGTGVIAVSGKDLHRIFNIDGPGSSTSIDVVISGLTLTHGHGAFGGAIKFQDANLTVRDAALTDNVATGSNGGGAIASADGNEDLVIENTTITGNSAGNKGGGVYFYSPDGGTFTMTNSTVSNNTADGDGGGISIKGEDSNLLGAVSITGSQITGNSADGNGGGLFAYYIASLDISTTTISGNTAANSGGGLFVNYVDGNVDIAGSTISGNTAQDGQGGGMYLSYVFGNVSITDTTISNNVNLSPPFKNFGGGGVSVYHVTGTLSIENGVITGNSTGAWGGGLYLKGVDGTTTIASSTVAGNSAHDWGGGIEWYENDGNLVIRNSTLSGNTARDGAGGIYLSKSNYGSVSIYNSTISGNTTGGEGGGIVFSSYYGLTIVESTITNNTATTIGGIYIAAVKESTVSGQHQNSGAKAARQAEKVAEAQAKGKAVKGKKVKEPKVRTAAGSGTKGQLTLVGTIIAGDAGTDVGKHGNLTATSSLIGSIVGTTLTDKGGNLKGVDPLLGALADNGGPTRTHALLPGSPAIDAGPNPLTPFPGSDFDQRGTGYARVVAGIVDIGAFEVQPVIIQPTFTG